MFYRRSDASKAALVGLVDLMKDGGSRLIDVQWLTDHLRAMGCSEVKREEYLKKVSELTLVEGPSWGSY
jgi:leucyl/phenylalanyl-tRNA--protein transferase